jgi:hypothetical protein
MYNYIDKFLANYINEKDFWEVVQQNLADELLCSSIVTLCGFSYKLADMVDNLTVSIQTKIA